MLLNRWFAVQVRPNSEKLVVSLLQFKGCEVFLPIYHVTQPRGNNQSFKPQVKPLFPGYVFCRLGSVTSGLIVTTPGVIRIVGTGNRAEPIEEREIEALKTLVRSGMHLRPWPKLEEGVAVAVTGGPLRDCQGTFRTYKGEDQLVISLSLLQRSVTVAIHRDLVTPLTSVPRKPVSQAQAVAVRQLSHAAVSENRFA